MSPIDKHHTEFRWLDVSQIEVDRRYQRARKEKWIKRISENIDLDALGVPHVSERSNGRYFAIDGQQRMAALKLRPDVKQHVRCKLYAGLTVAEEAELFRLLNDDTGLRYIDRFRPRLVEGDPDAVAIGDIVCKCGFRIGEGTVPGAITAVQALEQVYLGWRARTRGGKHPDALRWTLETIREAWGTDPAGLRGEIIKSLGLIFLRDGISVDRRNLVKKLALAAGGAMTIVGRARGILNGRPGSRIADATAEVIVNLYNKGRRSNKIEDWRS